MKVAEGSLRVPAVSPIAFLRSTVTFEMEPGLSMSVPMSVGQTVRVSSHSHIWVLMWVKMRERREETAEEMGVGMARGRKGKEAARSSLKRRRREKRMEWVRWRGEERVKGWGKEEKRVEGGMLKGCCLVRELAVWVKWAKIEKRVSEEKGGEEER